MNTFIKVTLYQYQKLYQGCDSYKSTVRKTQTSAVVSVYELTFFRFKNSLASNACAIFSPNYEKKVIGVTDDYKIFYCLF